MRPANIPPRRPAREVPTYQTPPPTTPTTINNTAGAVITTLGNNNAYPSGKRGRGLPFWLNREKREEDARNAGKIQPTTGEEEFRELDE